MTAPQQPAAPPDVSPWHLVATLGSAGAFAGILLIFVFSATQPTIRRNKAAALQQAIQEVLKAPDRYDTLYVLDGVLTRQLPEGTDGEKLEQVYLGYAADDRAIGFAMAAGKPGFQDVIRIIFGYDAASNTLLGMKVLESKETPGLGDKIEKDLAFVTQFDGAHAPLIGVKSGRGKGDEGEVDMITGATISSRTVIKIINETLERLGPQLALHGDGRH